MFSKLADCSYLHVVLEGKVCVLVSTYQERVPHDNRFSVLQYYSIAFIDSINYGCQLFERKNAFVLNKYRPFLINIP